MNPRWVRKTSDLPAGMQDWALGRAGVERLEDEVLLIQTMGRPLSCGFPWAPMGALIVTSQRVVYAMPTSYRPVPVARRVTIIPLDEVREWSLGSRWKILYTGIWGARSIALETGSKGRLGVFGMEREPGWTGD